MRGGGAEGKHGGIKRRRRHCLGKPWIKYLRKILGGNEATRTQSGDPGQH